MEIRDLGPERFSHGDGGMDWREFLHRVVMFLLGLAMVGLSLIMLAIAL